MTVTATGPTENGPFVAGATEQVAEDEERYLKWRDGQRMSDAVMYYLRAAVAFSVCPFVLSFLLSVFPC